MALGQRVGKAAWIPLAVTKDAPEIAPEVDTLAHDERAREPPLARQGRQELPPIADGQHPPPPPAETTLGQARQGRVRGVEPDRPGHGRPRPGPVDMGLAECVRGVEAERGAVESIELGRPVAALAQSDLQVLEVGRLRVIRVERAPVGLPKPVGPDHRAENLVRRSHQRSPSFISPLDSRERS